MSESQGTDRATSAAEPDLAWHRMHRITPLLNAWKTIVAVLVIAAIQLGPDLSEDWGLGRPRILLIVGGVVVVGGGLVVVYSEIAWRMMRYAVDAEHVYLQSGVLYRRHRQARLDRMQAVDVVQPLIARLVGLAQLTIEQAGGQDSRIVLAYLTEARAQELRNELIARAAGVEMDEIEVDASADAAATTHGGPGAEADGAAPGVLAPDVAGPGVAGPRVVGSGAGTDAPAPAAPGPSAAAPTDPRAGRPPAAPSRWRAPEAPEHEIFAVPVGRLIGSIAVSGGMLFLLLAIAGIIVAAVASRSFAPLGGMLPALLGAGGYIWSRFSGEFSFRAAISPDGIRLRHGLTESRAQTVPPGRVQAVRLTQPLLWRRPDWWRVRINVAGYGGEGAARESTLLPVGSREEALLALWLVVPDLGEPEPRAVLEAGLTGLDDAAGFLPSPRRARFLDPIAWRRNGIRVTPTALLLRSGRLVRQLDVVPHERTQSLGLAQGPLQRRLRMSSFVIHSTPGPVIPRTDHLDAAAAAELIIVQAERARSARRAAGPEKWMRRPG